jgi:hypothetical protein
MQNLKKSAQALQRQGRGYDKILAHINPMEAMELAQKYGGSINKRTGLPQYGGLLYSLDRMLGRPSAKKVREQKAAGTWKGSPASKFIAPMAGIIGNTLMPGMGSFIGGAVGGMMGPKNRRPGPLMGAIQGWGASKVFDVGKNLWQGQPAMSGIFGDSQTGGGWSMPAANKLAAENANRSGFLSSLFGGGQGAGVGSGLSGLFNDPLTLGLGAATLYGMSKRKEKQHYPESPEEAGERNRRMRKASWGPEDQPRRVKPLNRKYVQPPAGSSPVFGGEHQYFEDVNPETEYYASGGYVDGNSGGQEDNRPTHLHEGDYVMNAMDTSLLGDGNSENGKLRLQKMEEKVDGDSFKSSLFKASVKKPNALVSDGEYVVKRDTVKKMGGGSLAKGEKEFNKFRKNLRKHKGVEKILPPKTKDTFSYFKG